MKSLSLLAATILVISALCGCERQSPLIKPDESVAIRNIAVERSDTMILEAAKLTADRFVKLDGEVIAEWVPLCEDVRNKVEGAVTRQTQAHTEVLVLHSANDISDSEIASIKALPDRANGANGERTLITLTDAGSRILFSFTVDHVGQSVAVIASGEIRAIPKIASPVRKEMTLSQDRIDKVSVVSSTVN